MTRIHSRKVRISNSMSRKVIPVIVIEKSVKFVSFNHHLAECLGTNDHLLRRVDRDLSAPRAAAPGRARPRVGSSQPNGRDASYHLLAQTCRCRPAGAAGGRGSRRLPRRTVKGSVSRHWAPCRCTLHRTEPPAYGPPESATRRPRHELTRGGKIGRPGVHNGSRD